MTTTTMMMTTTTMTTTMTMIMTMTTTTTAMTTMTTMMTSTMTMTTMNEYLRLLLLRVDVALLGPHWGFIILSGCKIFHANIRLTLWCSIIIYRSITYQYPQKSCLHLFSIVLKSLPYNCYLMP